MVLTAILVLLILVLVAAVQLAQGWQLRRLALARIAGEGGQGSTLGLLRDSALQQWLAKSGYRQPNAVSVFLGLSAAMAGAGLIVSQLYRLVLLDSLLRTVSNLPGTTSDMLGLVLAAGPWILFVGMAMVPTLVVRTVRRTRMHGIEQDLPLALELFATMGQAGLGFDAAVAKIVRALGAERPLAGELANFQHDMIAGMPRPQALRQLARRVDLPALTSFTSALIQAETVGASFAETLQHQAVELRSRRRENALLQAQALPVKLVFPLVICFLPGIFASTLAPVLFQVVQVADGVLRGAGR